MKSDKDRKRINCYGYVEHKVIGSIVWRNWWLVPFKTKTGIKSDEACGGLYIGNLSFPSKFVGKKVRIKVEIVEEE